MRDTTAKPITGELLGTLKKTEGTIDVEIPRIAVDTDALTFPATPQIEEKDTVQESAEIDCKGKSVILIKVDHSANNVEADIRLVLKDSSDQFVYSSVITPTNTTIDNGSGRFHSELIILQTLGATAFKLRLDSVPTNGGNTSIYGASI